MREFIVENLTSAETISFAVIVLNNLVAMAAAFFVMLAYKVTYSGTAYSRKFNISLGAITIITTMIMSVISNNIALSLGMVGALSIIRFRTAVKDVRDAASFLAIAAGIGCGVSQYLLIGVGSVFLLLFLLLTKNVVSSGKQLMVVQGRPEAQNQIEAVVSGHFDGKAHLNVKNLSAASCELVYSIREGDLAKANEKNMIDIAQRLMKLEGVERVNLVEQQDDISR
ncbi:DUF4956 domain-containing protein [Lachnospiraceae bacterium OF09-33XD]|nr:DUF4956 domain-containing protein [Lachnospiraceae bacterium OF09-33XD]